MSNVLFVEDEADLRTLMFEALSDQGYTVTLARNGREALLALGGEVTFSHVISDISMPEGVTGIDVANQAAQIQPGVRIVLASGYQRSQLPPLPPRTRFLPKPYRIRQLINALQDL